MSAAGGPADRWNDLTRRLASTAVLLLIGAALALSTGRELRLFISALTAVTFWELARMTALRMGDPRRGIYDRIRPMLLAVLGGFCLFVALTAPERTIWLLLLPLAAGLPGARPAERVPFALFGAAILLVGFILVELRTFLGLGAILWVMGVVVISDTLGYFAGRMLGGPKFWPRLSPKKTWSGTVAGWIGAAAFGLALWASGHGGPALVWLSPLLALAGQMGDIAESWLKRRAGVKDSSNLIPGHGGLMDRFDAVSGAVLMVGLLDLVGLLPDTP